MPSFNELVAYVETIDRGGFTAAAERLGLSKQLVSHRVSALESRLGVRLLLRTTRRVTPTPAGLEYAERARAILRDLADADDAVASGNPTPRGRLRISAPMSFGTLHLARPFAAFLSAYPEVQLDVDLNDRPVDLIAEGYDMAVRIGYLADSTLIARRLLPLQLWVCASPDYLATRGTPESPDALEGHVGLTYGHTPAKQMLFAMDGAIHPLSIKAALESNNGELLRTMAIAGHGITQLPEFIIGQDVRQGRLTRVLADFDPPPGGAYVISPKHRQRSSALRSMTDHLVDTFSVGLVWSAG